MEVFIPIIILLLLCLIVAASKWIELAKVRRLCKLVAWSVSDNRSVMSRESPEAKLSRCLFRAQSSIGIDTKCRLCLEDTDEIHDILAAFRNHLAKSYFSGNVAALIPSSESEEEEYFFLSLYVFICDSKCNWEESVFLKMKYISFKYCRSKEHLKKYVPAWAEENIKQELSESVCGKEKI